MEFTIVRAGLITTIAGIASFCLGVSTELAMMARSTPEQLKDGKFKCNYPYDNAAYLGYTSLVLTVIMALVGSLHKYHTNHGIKAPVDAYSHSNLLKIFFFLAMFMDGLAFYMIFQPLYTVHRLRDQSYAYPIVKCPTHDKGMVGGGALASFGACLMWIIVLIIASNCREDFIRGSDGNSSVGSYGLIDDDVDAW